MLNQVQVKVGMDIPMRSNVSIIYKVRHVFHEHFMAERISRNIVNPIMIPFDFNGKNLDGMRGYNLDMALLSENLA